MGKNRLTSSRKITSGKVFVCKTVTGLTMKTHFGLLVIGFVSNHSTKVKFQLIQLY